MMNRRIGCFGEDNEVRRSGSIIQRIHHQLHATCPPLHPYFFVSGANEVLLFHRYFFSHSNLHLFIPIIMQEDVNQAHEQELSK